MLLQPNIGMSLVAKTALSIAVAVVAPAASVVWFRQSITRHGLVTVVG